MFASKKTDFQLAVVDSRGLPEEAKKAVRTLVLEHHVIGIIGGVLSKTALAIAEEAQNFGVPAILLSQKSGLTQNREYIFQNSLNARRVVDGLVEVLMKKFSYRSFALLYPNDSYGVDYANHFWSAVEKRGGEIQGVQVYKPGETDFNGPLRRLTGTYYKSDREEEYRGQLKKWYKSKNYHPGRRVSPPAGLLPPRPEFQVLFVPDSAKVLSVIASHLAYNDIKDILLAGPFLWNPEQKKKALKQTKVFFTTTGLNNPAFRKSSFYREFHAVFGHPPGLFETQAYESALVFRQLMAAGVKSRSGLKKALSRLTRFHGPMGWVPINESREFVRPLPVYKLDKKISLVFDPLKSLL